MTPPADTHRIMPHIATPHVTRAHVTRPHVAKPRVARSLLVALAACATLAASASQAAAGVAPRLSLLDIERQVMCVTCKVDLDESQSPQANLEREYIQSLIDRGEGEAQIKRSLVAQYGPTVLALPAAHGFDLTVYLVPLAVVLALLLTVALLLPGWRRRARTRADASSGSVALSPADAARLDTDLARFD
jgi:cytochrome c-type biogenesis protein CcmH